MDRPRARGPAVGSTVRPVNLGPRGTDGSIRRRRTHRSNYRYLPTGVEPDRLPRNPAGHAAGACVAPPVDQAARCCVGLQLSVRRAAVGVGAAYTGALWQALRFAVDVDGVC